MTEKIKLATIVPVPFCYQIPLYRRLKTCGKVDLTVYYCLSEPARFPEAEDGYDYKFLKNNSPFPSLANRPLGLMNLGIWREIKDNQYDAVLIQAWDKITLWLAFAACLIYKTPIIFFTDANNLSIGIRASWKKWLKNFVFKNILFKMASGFLTTSSVNENFYKEYGVPKEKMVSLHYTYRYEDFLEASKNLNPQRKSIRASFGINDEDFVLLFVGRLSHEKNILNLLDAYKKVGYEKKKLFIVGEGYMRAKIQKHIKDSGMRGVFLEGFKNRQNLFKYYVLADGFVLPSTDEPWGMVVNEAMCFNLPVIASDKVGAAVDLMKDGYNGFIFPAQDTEKLAECIGRLINLPSHERQTFGRRSFEIANKWVNELDPVKQILKMMEVIKSNKSPKWKK